MKCDTIPDRLVRWPLVWFCWHRSNGFSESNEMPKHSLAPVEWFSVCCSIGFHNVDLQLFSQPFFGPCDCQQRIMLTMLRSDCCFSRFVNYVAGWRHVLWLLFQWGNRSFNCLFVVLDFTFDVQRVKGFQHVTPLYRLLRCCNCSCDRGHIWMDRVCLFRCCHKQWHNTKYTLCQMTGGWWLQCNAQMFFYFGATLALHMWIFWLSKGFGCCCLSVVAAICCHPFTDAPNFDWNWRKNGQNTRRSHGDKHSVGTKQNTVEITRIVYSFT